jgi:hypothetical protein
MGRMGDLDIDSSKAVSKPLTGIQNKTHIQFSANTMLKNQIITPTHNQDQTPGGLMNSSQFVRPIRLSSDMTEIRNPIRFSSMNGSSYEGVIYNNQYDHLNSLHYLKPSASQITIPADNHPESEK